MQAKLFSASAVYEETGVCYFVLKLDSDLGTFRRPRIVCVASSSGGHRVACCRHWISQKLALGEKSLC